jgi:AraC-like DNA-binding protein
MIKTIAIIGLIQTLFGIVIFITKRPRHLSFTFLTIWLAVIAVFLGSGLLPFEVVDYFKPGVMPILFLFGPLLYLYVSSLSIENFCLKKSQILHLLPMIAVALHRSTIDVVPVSSPSNLAENPSFIYNKIYFSLLLVSLFVYWIFSLKLILKHRKTIPFQFSNYTAKNSLSWLILVLSIFLLLFVSDFVFTFLIRVLEIKVMKISFLHLNLTLFAFIMIFFGINQSSIYKTSKITLTENEIPDNPENSESKPARSVLNDKQIEELTNTILQYLKTKKPYLNPDYSLQMMADDLNISRHKLSETINNGQKKNFYKLINEFRVQEVKEMLVNPAFSHYSVLGVGLECGFNSKSSFNRIFKEETGFTPSEFKRTV